MGVPFVAQYVESIDDPTVRLDLSLEPYCLGDGWDFGSPQVRGQEMSGQSRDGDELAFSTLSDATIQLPLVIDAEDSTALHTAVDALAREVNRDGVLMVTFGDAEPRFLVTRRGQLRHLSTAVHELSRPTIVQDRSPFIYGALTLAGEGTLSNDPSDSVVIVTEPIAGEAPTPSFMVRVNSAGDDDGVYMIHKGEPVVLDTWSAYQGSNFSGATTITFASSTAFDAWGISSVGSPVPPDGSPLRFYRLYAHLESNVPGTVFDVGFTPESGFPGDGPITVVRWTAHTPVAGEGRLVDFGVLQLPDTAFPGQLGEGQPLVVNGQRMLWWAGRISGAGTLSMRSLVLAPADESSAYVDLTQAGGDDVMLDADSQHAYPVALTGTVEDPEIRGAAVGIGGNDIVGPVGVLPLLTPGEENSITVLKPRSYDGTVGYDDPDDTFDYRIYYRPRYLSVR